MQTGHALALALAITWSASAAAQLIKPVDAPAAPVGDASRTQFAQDLAHLREAVRACKVVSSACAAEVGPDDKVAAEAGAPGFTVRWDWLREALKTAASAKPEDRAATMDQAAAHLDELAAESGLSADPAAKELADAEFAKAQKTAAEVLSRREFQSAQGPSWWQRKLARVQMWIAQLFEGVGRLGRAAPWLGTLLEWLCFVGAAAGLLLFAWRAFARQQMQISMPSRVAQWNAWNREVTDWATAAESHASRREWREAVHCLYWAAILRLESRRAWRHNPARTPREYVRLLKAGSPQQGALRGLTGIFERVWYGLREAEARDYECARTLFEGLSESALTPTPEPQA